MGAKRKAVSPPAKVSPGNKKARKSETPESIALSKLLGAFEGEVGTMLPANVVQIVNSVVDKCLMTPVETRDELEMTFAKVVGQALQTAMDGLQQAHKDAIEGVATEEEKVQALQTTLDAANASKDQADKELEDAQGAQLSATEKKSDAESELEAHVEEENLLLPKKELMQSDVAGLKDVSATVRGPPNPPKKEVQKLQKALKEVNTPASLIAGIAEAIGKETALDQHFVGEAAKLLCTKATEIEAELAKFETTVAEYAEKTTLLQAKVDQLTTDLTERDTELVAAKQKQKDCIAAIKEAEKQKKQGDKSLEKATQYRDEKASAEGVGADAGVQYKFLLERTGATAPEAPAPEAPAEVEVAAA